MLYPPEAFKSTDEAVVEQWSMAQLLHSEADKPVYEVLQYAGEMLVIPPGWWHAVVTLAPTWQWLRTMLGNSDLWKR